MEEILLDAVAYVGESPTATASDLTRNGETIEVSFSPAHPPLPSRLHVHSGAGAFPENPRVLRMVDGVILLRVAIRSAQPNCSIRKEERDDYFVYRVDRNQLRRLPPHPVSFRDDEVGLLPRGDDHFTVAALVGTGNSSAYLLHLLHSETWRWRSIRVPVERPQQELRIGRNWKASRLASHWNSTVITLGGQGGTMGWVDLWRGILLCDVLSPNPALKGVPLPLPAQLQRNERNGDDLGSPKPYRGIAYVKENRCLHFVELETRGVCLSEIDDETGLPLRRFDSWKVTSWSNSNMTDAIGDWEMVCEKPVKAKHIEIDKRMRIQLEGYRLLHRPKASPQASLRRGLQNLWVFQPIPSMDSISVVYLMIGAKFLDSKAWVLAVDMRNNQLQGVSEFGTEREPGEGIVCCPGSVSAHEMSAATSQASTVGCAEAPEGGRNGRQTHGRT
ncbi:hypothetical protein ACP70R_024176 [Stipagrostis hirtigluma subsp. patula]